MPWREEQDSIILLKNIDTVQYVGEGKNLTRKIKGKNQSHPIIKKYKWTSLKHDADKKKNT